NRVVEYPARDMTITVEAGITLAALAEVLAQERQRLAVDAAQASQATLGGLIATNFSGPRRYGCGTIRDYVIGMTAVDGRGVAFHGGGRVVKNVAGYDFCKLLTGSLGTLGVISQVTLKLKPTPEASALVACEVSDASQADHLLAALGQSKTTPAAVELFACGARNSSEPVFLQSPGPAGYKLAVGLEGTSTEVNWMVDRLQSEWKELGVDRSDVLADAAAAPAWSELVEFPSQPAGGMVLRAAVLPSNVLRFMEEVLQVDAGAALLSHAGNGVVLVRLDSVSPAELPGLLVQRLQPLAASLGGNIVVYAAPDECGLTRQTQWGTATADATLMRSVQEQFDPQGVLNPGRFVYGK
ncbi:MAG: FAD-binding oxidoreductase, partial [Pirellulales bacterium]